MIKAKKITAKNNRAKVKGEKKQRREPKGRKQVMAKAKNDEPKKGERERGRIKQGDDLKTAIEIP